jgi:RND family efflux transporter MFP subunit
VENLKMNKEKPQAPDLASLRIDPNVRIKAASARRNVIITVVSALLIMCGVLVFAIKNQTVTVEVAIARSPSESGGTVVLNASGYVTPRRRSTVAAKITGRVKEMLVEEGMRVKEGQIIAYLDDAEAKAQLAAAQADLQVAQAAIHEIEVNAADAQRTLKRIKNLHREQVASQENLDHSKAAADALEARRRLALEQVQAAESRLAVARQDLENCTVRAPFSGIVVSKDAQVGEMVSPISAGGGFTRTGIATIVDMDSLEIEVDVNESYIAKVSIGQKVDAVLDAYPEWHIPGSVRTTIPTADRQKATVKVRIAFDQLDPRILPDMGVKVSFLSEKDPTRQSAAQALVPKEAILDINGKKTVFRVVQNKLEQCPVKLGEERGTDVEIIDGLSSGDAVVTSSPGNLRHGQRAEIK